MSTSKQMNNIGLCAVIQYPGLKDISPKEIHDTATT